MGCFVVAEFLLTSASRGPSASRASCYLRVSPTVSPYQLQKTAKHLKIHIFYSHTHPHARTHTCTRLCGVICCSNVLSPRMLCADKGVGNIEMIATSALSDGQLSAALDQQLKSPNRIFSTSASYAAISVGFPDCVSVLHKCFQLISK